MGCQLCKTYVKALFGFGAKSVSPAPANSSGGFYPGIPHKILFKTQARNRDVAVAFISRCDQRIPHLMCKFNCAANLENISLRMINLSFLFIKPIDQQQMRFILSCWFFIMGQKCKADKNAKYFSRFGFRSGFLCRCTYCYNTKGFVPAPLIN